jgi:hypothetical protein
MRWQKKLVAGIFVIKAAIPYAAFLRNQAE